MHIWRILKNYLSNRAQLTRLNNCNSSTKQMICGVPQGSTLGPLLFILSNDLSDFILNVSLKLFADDTVFYYSTPNIKTLVAGMCRATHAFNEWCCLNKIYDDLRRFHYLTKQWFWITWSTAKNVECFQKLQNRVLKCIYKSGYTANKDDLHQRPGLLKVADRRKLNLITMGQGENFTIPSSNGHERKF